VDLLLDAASGSPHGEGGGVPGTHDPAILAYNSRLLQDVASLLAAAAVGGVAAGMLGVPPSFGYLVGGAVAGPSGLGLVVDLEHVGTVAQFGVVFPLFANGLQFHLKDHARFHRQAAASALALSASLMALFAVAGPATGVVASVPEGLLVGLATSLCSPGVAIANLVYTGHLTRTAGHIGTGILAAQDLLMGLLLSLPQALAPHLAAAAEVADAEAAAAAGAVPLPALQASGAAQPAGGGPGRRLLALEAGSLRPRAAASPAHGPPAPPSSAHGASGAVAVAAAAGALVKSAAAFTLVVIVTALVSRRIVPSVVDYLGRQGQQRDVHLLALVALCMGLGVATESAGLSLEMGAFFAGLMVSGSKDIARVMRAVDPLAQVFSGMFFASIGLVISPSYVLARAPSIVGSTLVLFAAKTVVLVLVIRWLGFHARHAVAAALALAQVSEYSLIFAGKAHAVGLLSRATYLRWMTATIATLVTSPLLARAAPFLVRVVSGPRTGEAPGAGGEGDGAEAAGAKGGGGSAGHFPDSRRASRAGTEDDGAEGSGPDEGGGDAGPGMGVGVPRGAAAPSLEAGGLDGAPGAGSDGDGESTDARYEGPDAHLRGRGRHRAAGRSSPAVSRTFRQKPTHGGSLAKPESATPHPDVPTLGHVPASSRSRAALLAAMNHAATRGEGEARSSRALEPAPTEDDRV